MTAYNFQQLIDFTRTSSATFVGSNGLIQNTPASVNLLTWTQEFDNAVWTKTDTTVTANSLTAPDGTGTGDTLTEGSAGSAQVGATGIAPTAGATTPYSIYLKRGNTDWVRVQILNGANGFRAWFNLNTGAVGTSGALGTGTLTEASIVNAGDGWYRCILVGAIPSTTTYSVFTNTASANNSGTRVSGGTYAAWGAQLEVGSTATAYTRNVGGLFPARFDYDPVTLAPRGILIEEQRVNRTLRSEDFTVSPWVAAVSGTSTRVNDGAPLGFTRGLITATSALGGIRQTHTGLSSGQVYALSFYTESASTSVQIVFENGTANFGSSHFVTINPSGGTAGALTGFTSVLIQPFGSGYVYTLVTAPAGGALVANIEWRITNSGDSIWLGRPQFEAGGFATSYIPTVASQVTRTADQASIVAPMFAPWYNQTEGSWVAEWMPYVVTGTVVAQISAATNNDRFQLLNDNGSQIAVTTAGVGQGGIDAGTVLPNAINKLAYGYRTNDTAASLAGGVALPDNTVTLPVVDRLTIGATVAAAGHLNGHIRRITYYPVRLLDTQLQALTS